MKAAIVGTEAYHETMQAIVRELWIQKMRYVLPAEQNYSELPSVASDYADCSDAIMQYITGDTTIQNCKPQIPYLFFAWLLIGSDNIYRVSLHDTRLPILQSLAKSLIALAFGFAPPVQIFRRFLIASPYRDYLTDSPVDTIANMVICISNGDSDTAKRAAAKSIHNVALPILRISNGSMAHKAYLNLCATAKVWSEMDNKQVFSVARNLIYDLLLTEDAKLKE